MSKSLGFRMKPVNFIIDRNSYFTLLRRSMRPGLFLEYIAEIQSCYPDKFGTPRQPGLVSESTAIIRFFGHVQPEEALQGLEGFSHLWVLFHFHKNNSARYHAKVHPPRMGGQQTGVFSTRSPHRPNPIGLSLVEILKIEGSEIHIRGIDLIQGTPVFDVKPYLPEIESKPLAQAGWTTMVNIPEVEIAWEPEQLQLLQKWSADIQKPHLRTLIEDTLRLDPRPQVYKGYEGQESPYRNVHAVRFFNGDVHFEFMTPDKIRIHKVIPDTTIGAYNGK